MSSPVPVEEATAKLSKLHLDEPNEAEDPRDRRNTTWIEPPVVDSPRIPHPDFVKYFKPHPPPAGSDDRIACTSDADDSDEDLSNADIDRDDAATYLPYFGGKNRVPTISLRDFLQSDAYQNIVQNNVDSSDDEGPGDHAHAHSSDVYHLRAAGVATL